MKFRKWIVGGWLIGAATATAGDGEERVERDGAYAWLARIERAAAAAPEPQPELGVEPAAPESCLLPFVDRRVTTSTVCMTCHDGSNPAAFEVRHDVSHRMDFDYAEFARAKQDPDLAEQPDLVMPEGKLTCTTCHDAEPGLKDWIAKPNKQLCLSCHRMN